MNRPYKTAIARDDQDCAVPKQDGRTHGWISVSTGKRAGDSEGPRLRIIKFSVSPNYQDSAVIEQGGYPTPGLEHGASRGEGSCGRVVKFGARQCGETTGDPYIDQAQTSNERGYAGARHMTGRYEGGCGVCGGIESRSK